MLSEVNMFLKKFLPICCVLFLLSCSEDNILPSTKFQLSGKIIFLNSMTDDVIENQISQVRLFNLQNEFIVLREIKTNYDFLGSEFDDALFYDHRLLGDPYRAVFSDSNGDFEFPGVSEGEYIIVYLAEGFGWHKQFLNITSNKNIELSMRQTINQEQMISEDTIWKANSHILIENDLFINENIELTIEENVVVEISSSSIIIFGDIHTTENPETPVIFTSSNINPQKGDWVGFKNYSFDNAIENCIIQWSFCGILSEGFGNINNVAIINSSQCGINFNYKSGIVNNSIVWDSHDGIYGYFTKEDSMDFMVNNSIIAKNDDNGIKLYEASPQIYNSCFELNNIHISAKYNSYPSISYCNLKNSYQYSIYSTKEYDHIEHITINKCEFSDDNDLIRLNRSAEIAATDNNFFTSGEYVFNLTWYYGGNVVSAQNNWWDTSIEMEIQDLIYDESNQTEDEYDAGFVDYSNWRNSRISDTGPHQ
jgi:hypothetical protein